MSKKILNKRSKVDFTVRNVYLFNNISEGTAFLLQGLTYNEKVKLRRYNLKLFFYQKIYLSVVISLLP